MPHPVILYENEHLIIVNKPAGLLSIPDREGKETSLKTILLEQFGSIFTIHRLDKETSGIIAFAKDEETHQYMSTAFEERKVEKYYLGIVKGELAEKEKTIDLPLMEHPHKKGTMVFNKKGKPSITDYKVIEEFGKFSLIQFQIHTGRTHQIRVHMQSVGHPIVCDPLYGDGSPIFVSSIKRDYKLSLKEEEERPILSRLGLHAQKLKFQSMDGKIIEAEAELPKDMRALLQQLRKVRLTKVNKG